MACKSGCRPYYNKFHSCSCHSHIHTAQVGKKSNFPVIITSDKANKNHIPLLPLEAIDCVYCDFSLQPSQNISFFRIPTQPRHLSFVWRNNRKIQILILDTLLSYPFYIRFKAVEHKFTLIRIDPSPCRRHIFSLKRTPKKAKNSKIEHLV